MKKTIVDFKKSKESGTKLSLLTAYDYSTAKMIDSSGVDGILVGDSLAMVFLGHENTLQVTMEEMLHHTRAVARGTGRALLIGDMPFMSYHISTAEAVKNAGRFVQEGGAQAVKLEGGAGVIRQIRAIVRAQIPVMGHLGLTPQSVHMFGGFRVQGQDEKTAKMMMEDAKRIEDAGAFSVVLECIPAEIAQRITENISIPTIGIGAGASCDGQILVYADMLGLYGEWHPKFVKQYADLGTAMRQAVLQYTEEVKSGAYPQKEHTFSLSEDVLQKLY